MRFNFENIKKEVVLRTAKNLLLVVIGTLILAFGSAVFLIPFNLVSGGISGIAIVIDEILKSEVITIDLIVSILTWLFFFLGLIIVGKSFAMKTLVSAIVYPVGISLFLKLAEPSVLGGYFYLVGGEYQQIAFILASLVGGACVGIGCAVAFLGGGSTGGVDVIAFTICKIFPRLKSSKVIFAIDAIIVILGVFVIKDMVVSLLGILSAFIAALLIDRVFLGGSRAFIAEIVSEHYEKINREVIEKMERTTTVIDVVGGYSGENKKMLKVSFTMAQYSELMRIISSNDRSAFVTIHRAHAINGEGWTR